MTSVVALASALGLALGGCAPDQPLGRDVALASCSVREAVAGGAGADDTLRVRVRVGGEGPVALLVRVDAPGEAGSSARVSPQAPPTAAAAAVSMSTLGVYRGCLSDTPAEIRFEAPEAPFGRAWMRITTRRPVRASLQAVSPGAVAPGDEAGDASVVVLPGHSGRVGR